MPKRISNDLIGIIIKIRNETGHSFDKIGNIINMSPDTVNYLYNRHYLGKIRAKQKR